MNTIYETKKKSTEKPKKDIGERKDYYVYHLIDPRDGKPFYVGKGRKRRMYSHEREVRNGKFPNGCNGKLYSRINGIIKENNIIYKKVLEDVSSEEAFAFEGLEYYRLKNNNLDICNLAPGGEGGSGKGCLGKTWEEISGKENASKRKEAMKRRFIINGHPRKGTHHSEKTKKKCGEYNVGRPGPFKGRKNPIICGENHGNYIKIPNNIYNRIKELYKSMSINKIITIIEEEYRIKYGHTSISNRLKWDGIYIHKRRSNKGKLRAIASKKYKEIIIELYKKMGIQKIRKYIQLNHNENVSEVSIKNTLKNEGVYRNIRLKKFIEGYDV